MHKGHSKRGESTSPLPEGAGRALRRPLALTWLGMVAERGARAFWPLWSWGLLTWVVLSFDLTGHLPVEAAYVAALVLVGGLAGFLIWGLRHFRWPSAAEAAERLDRSLPGRPLSALQDEIAVGARDRGTRAVWQAHIARMKGRLAHVRPVAPDLKLSRRDPWGLRYMAATGFVVAIIFGSLQWRPSDILPGGTAGVAAGGGPAFEGWIEPPRYTGLPAIYLNDAPEGEALPVPQGSVVVLRLYGGQGAVTVSQDISRDVSAGLSADAAAAQKDAQNDGSRRIRVARSGRLTIRAPGGSRQWRIEMIPDKPPMIAITGLIERGARGRMRLKFTAQDDYGVTGGTVTIRLDLEAVDRRLGLALPPETRPAILRDIPMPIKGDRRNFTETLIEDLSRSPWAGLPVILTVQAFDAAGHKATAEPESLILPGRRFLVPLAAAIAEQRRDLLWNRLNAPRVAQVLRGVSYRPEDIFDNMSAYLVLRSAIRRIEYNMNPTLPAAARDEVARMLWHVASLIEDGSLGDVQKRLERAQKRLSEALRKGASDAEIAALSRELGKAMQDYLEQMARSGRTDRQQARGGTSREITAEQLQRMLDRIAELSRQGRRTEARALLDQLNAIMRNLQTARRGQGGDGARQAMRGLGDTLRQQQQLSDDAFRKLQESFNDSGNDTGNDIGPGKNGVGGNDGRPATPDAGRLADRQQALGKLLDSQRRNLPGVTSKEGQAARKALKRAQEAMGRAQQALRQQDLPQALDDQAEALDALREGMRNLGRAIARRQGQPGGREQLGARGPGRDPLGRPLGGAGVIGSGRNLSLEDSPWRRSQELMREIRRRAGERARPRYERDYLKRLLDRF